ncbi:sensor histidine kinase [Horticoccus sp. 23ND18S-11]|uniref:sensor histidine kinase n=1 Tax=Horticoccus sp. 23ND18S-11 TaxID=3391832 RepID=UPI0039C8D4DB
MISLRTQLLAWLLPGFVLVCAAAGVGVYFSVRDAFEADLDARLGRLAGMARLALNNPSGDATGGPRGMTLRAFIAREDFKASGQYFEQWTPGGTAERRSPNLGDVHLPRPTQFGREAVRYDSTLDNGDRVRVSAMRFAQVGATPAAEFAVALSRKDGDERLSRLVVQLAVGGLAGCAALCVLLALALRFAMRPLIRLGDQAASMGASSLHMRFPAESMPSEVVPIVSRLNDLIARLEESFERERRFSGYLAHELRTPLAAIRSTSEVAAKWPEQSSSEDYAEIARITTRLQQTVDTLLLLSRTEIASADVVRESVPLRPLVEQCAALHAERVREREITLTLQIPDSLILKTDPRLLRIVVMNLIANAVEYTPPGSAVTIAGFSRDNPLEVSNPAPMLRPADLPNLFERLWRKDMARTDSAHAGLGLSLAQGCASALGFDLSADLSSPPLLKMSLRVKN